MASVRLLPRVRFAARRAFTVTASKQADVYPISAEDKARIHPRIGDRDIVGFGFNGTAVYHDRPEIPCPAIRFKPNTPEVLALREKEKGDWNKLSMEEKRELYRASFAHTFAEMNAPTGEWRHIVAMVLIGMSMAAWCVVWLKKFVYPPMPHTITRDWQLAQQQRMVDQQQGVVAGISSLYDQDKQQWKK